MAYRSTMRSRRNGATAPTLRWRRGSAGSASGSGSPSSWRPRSLARSLGMEEHAELIRAYGVREIATGVGILVAGRSDALDLGPGRRRRARSRDARARPRRRQPAPRQRRRSRSAAVAGVTALDVICAQQLTARERARLGAPIWDYSDRSGLPRPPQAMRGAARDFEAPEDMRIPEPLRPYTDA